MQTTLKLLLAAVGVAIAVVAIRSLTDRQPEDGPVPSVPIESAGATHVPPAKTQPAVANPIPAADTPTPAAKSAEGMAAPAPPAQTDAQAKEAPEPLPPAPKADPKSVLIEDPNAKGLFIEVLPDKKSRRVLLQTEVCLREGPLEIFMCKRGTKEHEAILHADYDALNLHEKLLLAGAAPGKPTQFINPKTDQAEYKPATGTRVKVSVSYNRAGKTYTHPAQEWIWDPKKKANLPQDWVFAGSTVFEDPDNKRKYYGANSGDVISISNFPYSMLEIPFEVSKDNDNLVYEAKTERIPPVRSKVWVILEPVLEKKK